MEAGPQIDPLESTWNLSRSGRGDSYALIYFSRHRPAFKEIPLSEEKRYTIEVIDTWEMTIREVEGTFSGTTRVDLPGKPYIALRIRESD